jgi:hypothetical protein
MSGAARIRIGAAILAAVLIVSFAGENFAITATAGERIQLFVNLEGASARFHAGRSETKSGSPFRSVPSLATISSDSRFWSR